MALNTHGLVNCVTGIPTATIAIGNIDTITNKTFTFNGWGPQINSVNTSSSQIIDLSKQQKTIESLVYKNTLLEREVDRLSRMIELIAVHCGLENIIEVPSHSVSTQECPDKNITCYFCKERADEMCDEHPENKSTYFTVLQKDKLKYYTHNCCLAEFKTASTHPLSEAINIGNYRCKN